MPARARRRSKLARLSTGPVRKHSVYFPEYVLAEIGAEATRLDRSLSWMVQQAWKMARAEIAAARQPGPAAREHSVTTFAGPGQTPADAAALLRLGGPATTAPPRR